MKANVTDHDILIELRTLLNVVVSRLDDNIKAVSTTQKEIEVIKEEMLRNNLPARVKAIEDDHEQLPLKEKELVSLIVWGAQFRSRYKLLLLVFGAVTSLIGFIVGGLIDVFRVLRP